jgi:segregation and condensation protein B
MTDKKKVESVLFAVGKEITVERLASLCSLDIKNVNKIMKELISDYGQRDNALKISIRENGWKLTVEDEFVPLVSSIVTSTELEKPLTETLAVIAWRYPIVQSEIVKLRGPSAYDHMRALVGQGFITKERFGRTYKVKLTQKFFNYFDLPSDEAKKSFLNIIPKDILEEAENVDKEADEVVRLIELDKKEKVAHSEIEKAMKEAKKEAKKE